LFAVHFLNTFRLICSDCQHWAQVNLTGIKFTPSAQKNLLLYRIPKIVGHTGARDVDSAASNL